MNRIAKLAVLVLPVLLVIGCGGKTAAVDKTAEEPMTSTSTTTTVAEPTRQDVIVADEPVGKTAESGADLLAEKKIYFDFDKSEVKPEFRDIIAAHASHLASNPGVSITLEGHCDERGTREYNMALGERRSNAVAKLLILQGARKEQIHTVSFGEEKPEVEGHDESAWKWNRRAIFVYPE